MGPGTKTRVVVLASGAGSLTAALLSATTREGYPARVVAVVTDVEGARVLDVARAAGVATVTVPMARVRADWDRAIARAVAAFSPDWVVSAGFMRILGPAFLEAFPARVVNTHPSLLPDFPGTHAVRDALAAGVRTTGCTVHTVDAGVDTGPVLAQRSVPVLPGDDEIRLHERIKVAERALLVEVVGALAIGRALPIAII